ncbi:hypothetical protein MKW92_048980 [Papaver armeniacum]|nr:hypothetical protein MKW92_048980 [Papaver armeniacum]
MTLSFNCRKRKTENHSLDKGLLHLIKRLFELLFFPWFFFFFFLQEYNVGGCSTTSEKNYFIGRFISGEKFKNDPGLVEDETGQFQYHGHLEGAQCAIAQYKQLTLEEAEEKIKNRRMTPEGFQRWIIKLANSGAAAFGNVSNNGDEDEKEEAQRKNRFGLYKRDGDDDEEGPRGGDIDMDDDNIEKRGKNLCDAPKVPAPPEIKQVHPHFIPTAITLAYYTLLFYTNSKSSCGCTDFQDKDDDDDEANEEEGGGLSKSVKELKKLLGRSAGMNASDDDDHDNRMMICACYTCVGSKKEGYTPKEGPVETPAKAAPSGSTRGTASTTSNLQSKRKYNFHYILIVQESKSSAKEGPASASSCAKASADLSTGRVTEEEIRTVLVQSAPLTTQELMAKFKERLKLFYVRPLISFQGPNSAVLFWHVQCIFFCPFMLLWDVLF